MSLKIFKKKAERKSRRGDTLVEVAFAIAVFSLITIVTIATMNKSLELMQGTLELSITRNEIDSQAEALRFIQNSYLSERELASNASADIYWREYSEIWHYLTDVTDSGLSNNPTKISSFTANTCAVYYDTNNLTGDFNHNIFHDKAFVLNTRNLDPANVNQTIVTAIDPNTNAFRTSMFKATDFYPRIIYSANTGSGETNEDLMEEIPDGYSIATAPTFDQVALAEGIWVVATRDVTGISNPSSASINQLLGYTPEYFDFYIRGCWYAPGNSYASTISTIIRLYNPEYIQED